jgi:hypothetical protein
MTGASMMDRLDAELEGGPRTWSDFIVVRNVGPLVSRAPLQGDRISTRGFNALVLGRAGTPSHFVKVRPVENEIFRDEAEMTARLSAHPASCHLVPRARTFVAGEARVLAEEFVDADSLEVQLRRTGPRRWAGSAAAMIGALPDLWAAIADAAGGEAGMILDTPNLLQELEALKAIGLESRAARELSAHLAASPAVAPPQHGDFWPRNILMTPVGPKVIDFESAGRVGLPLYDVFHMVRGCAEASKRNGADWIDAWAGTKGERALTAAVKRVTEGMTTRQVEAALVAYLVDFLARLYRRGNAPDRLAGRVRELNELPRRLERGALRNVLD